MAGKVRTWEKLESIKALRAPKKPCVYGSEELKKQIATTIDLLKSEQTGKPVQGIIDPRQNAYIPSGEAMDFLVMCSAEGKIRVLCDPKIQCQYDGAEKLHRKSCFSSPTGSRGYFRTPSDIYIDARWDTGEDVGGLTTMCLTLSEKQLIGFYKEALEKEISKEAFERAAVEQVVMSAGVIEYLTEQGDITVDELFMEQINMRRRIRAKEADDVTKTTDADVQKTIGETLDAIDKAKQGEIAEAIGKAQAGMLTVMH